LVLRPDRWSVRFAAHELEYQDDVADGDRSVRKTLDTIVTDEARHAELAWRTVRWAIDHGGAPVMRAIASEIDRLTSRGPSSISEQPRLGGSVSEHGLIDDDSRGQALDRAYDEVVLPSARALLQAVSPTTSQLTQLSP
jgi:hypothetical protein